MSCTGRPCIKLHLPSLHQTSYAISAIIVSSDPNTFLIYIPSKRKRFIEFSRIYLAYHYYV